MYYHTYERYKKTKVKPNLGKFDDVGIYSEVADYK